MRRSALLLLLATLAVPAAPARAGSGSLPSVAIGSRPGPEVLYAPPATAPQLQNTGSWQAPPLLISGHSAYIDGEYVYQDFIYDDHGSNTDDAPFGQPDSVPASTATVFGGATGDIVYPTDASRYGFNAADILEFRIGIVGDRVAYRITLNTLLDPSTIAVAIGIDKDLSAASGREDWGHGVGTLGSLGLEHVIAVIGQQGYLDGAPLPVTVDPTRNQIEIVTSMTPRAPVWRHFLIAGIAGGPGFAPILDNPTAASPGGAHRGTPPPVFNVGFRFDEPMGGATVANPFAATEPGPRSVGFGHWREHGQAKALAARDISAFHADVHFGTLAAGSTVVPRPTGWINRLYASRLDLGEGAKATRPMLLGKIQPYGVYVPEGAFDGGRSPLHLMLHSLSCTYNQYAVFAPRMLTHLGEERGAFMLTPAGRGPDGWYHDEAEVDVFEAWADLARNYALDPTRVTIGGYSMGGYGTYKLASQYPDLFSRGFSVVGPADENILGGPTGGLVESVNNTMRIAENMWNVPLMMWNGANDELVPVAGVLRHERVLADLGIRHQTRIYPGYDHFLFSVVDQWRSGAAFLGDGNVDRDPVHVKYRVRPAMDVPALGLTHDHAYWVSDVRAAAGAASGLIDVRSEATEAAHPAVSLVGAGAGLHLPLGTGGPFLLLETYWEDRFQEPRNALTVNLTDVSSATLWIERAGINPGEAIEMHVTSNSAAQITLAGTFGTRVIDVSPGTADLFV